VRPAPERLISVVVPVYEEAENIGPCLRGLEAALRDLPHEILVVYDFPEDGTLRAIAGMPDAPATLRLVRNDLGRGVAFALRKGLEEARGDVVVSTMADLSDPPEVIRAMARKIRDEGAQVVSGSRYMWGGQQRGGPFVKGLLSRLAGVSLHWLAGLGTHDATTSFRAYAGDYLRRVRVQSEHGFTVALELTVKAHRLGLRVDEVPTTWTDRTAGTSRFRVLSWLPHYLRWYGLALLPTARGAVTFLTALVLMLVLGLTWIPYQFSAALDSSWMIVLSEAFAGGRQFGRDLVFTYGPWGFVPLGVYHPATFSLMLAAQAFFCLALAAGVTALAALGFRRAWAGIAWAIAFCVFSAPLFGFMPDSAFVYCGAVLLLVHEADRAHRWRPVLVLLTVAVAWAGLIKFTYFVLGGVVVAAIAGADLLQRRGRWLTVPLTYALAVAVLWLAASQSLGGIVPFVRTSLEVAGGYSDAMAVWTHPAEQMTPFLVAGACLLGARAFATGARAGAPHTLALAWLYFQVFKGSFVRHDGHEMLAYLALPVLTLLYAPFLWRDARGWLGRALLASLVVASVWPQLAGWRLFHGQTYLGFVALNVQGAGGKLAAADRLLRGPDTARRLVLHYIATVRATQKRIPFPVPKGSVDLYPFEQAYIVAYRWPWAGRPVFQSYVAYTPALAELNAQHLRSERAPETIFFAVQTIDRRYPSLDDGLSWPELLARYEVRGSAGPYVWLERAAMPRPWTLAPVGTVTARFGEEVAVPAGDLVWARIDVRLTLYGRLVRALYKVPQPTLAVNGGARFQLVPDLAHAGFLLSPVVTSGPAFAALAMGKGGPVARSLRVEVDDARGLYLPEVGIEFFRLAYAP
jgi:glycosyltransferase involved in cell wall biosynthesis